MPHPNRCPKCGNEMSAATPTGVCPKCLLAAGLDANSEADQRLAQTMESPRSGEGFVAAAPHELAEKFPELEIYELLGKGGMGAVYKARQKSLDRIVALKILPPEVGRDPAFGERFQREARALARLNHPNVVTVYDFGNRDGLFFFLMEYVDGVNLRQAIKAGEMKPEDALAIVPQVCDALQYAHDVGVVHRDIKPENILLDRRGRAKIADFGLAKLLATDKADASLTHTHQIMGTLRYMAPEQMEGKHNIDHRADIYSLGVVFYELLTGELPIGRFAPPSKKVHIDVRLDEVVLRALEKEPDLRYQQVSEVKTEVEAIYRDLPPSLQMALGREYKSKTKIFGLPLVHIATGIDPRTGRKRVAVGIIAMGDIAVGGLAIGGGAVGIVAMGGAAAGLISLGGMSLGLLLAIGGCAVGLGLSFGGLAVGSVALGGMAVGYYAFGGGAVGMHTMSGAGIDPKAKELFEPWAYDWEKWLTLIAICSPIFFALTWCIIWLVFRLNADNREKGDDHGSRGDLRHRSKAIDSAADLGRIGKQRAPDWMASELPPPRTSESSQQPSVSAAPTRAVMTGLLAILFSAAQLLLLGLLALGAMGMLHESFEGRGKEDFETLLIAPVAALGLWGMATFVQSVIILIGGVALMRAHSPGWARAAGAAALMPCSPLWLLLLPLGIWLLAFENRPPVAAPQRSNRPLLVPVLATLNIIGALLLMLVTSADDVTPYADRFWVVWEQVDMILSFILAAAMFMASIGLYLWQPWARKMIVAVSAFGLFAFVVDIPYLTRAVIPHWASEIQADMKAELKSDDPVGGMIDELDLEGQTFFILFAIIGSIVSIWLVWMIGQLVYFTRPHVIAAFEGSDGIGSSPPPSSGGSATGQVPSWQDVADSALRRTWVRWILEGVCALIYAVCLVLFFGFQGGQEAAPDGSKVSWMKVGQPTPWMEVKAEKMGFRMSFHLISWSVAAAAVGIGVIALTRYSEFIGKGRAHSMWWHYGSWSVMFAVVLGLGFQTIYLNSLPRPPSVSPKAEKATEEATLETPATLAL